MSTIGISVARMYLGVVADLQANPRKTARYAVPNTTTKNTKVK